MSGPDGGGGEMAAAGKGGEIITLQVGTFANLVGAHYWNIQTEQFVFGAPPSDIDDDDIDGRKRSEVDDRGRPAIDVAHDCLFRAGSGAVDGRITYLPRAVVVDLNGIQPEVAPASLAPRSEVDPSWGGAVQTITSDARVVLPDAGQEMPWPDLLQWPLHSNSATIVQQYRHGDASAPFDRFPLGNSALANRTFATSFEDAVHFFLEECDRPQGLQLMMDMTDGFAGLGASIAEMLRDDHGKIPIFTIGTIAPVVIDDEVIAPISTAGWNGVPNPDDKYMGCGSRRAAELLGAALDTVTLAYRMKDSSHSLGSVAGQLTECAVGAGGNFASVATSLPLLDPLLGKPGGATTLSDALHEIDDRIIYNTVDVMTMTPDFNPSDTVPVAHCVVRGAGTGRASAAVLAAQRRVTEFDRCNSAHEMMQRYLAKSAFATKYFVTEARNPVPRLPHASSELFQHENAALGCLSADPAAFRGSLAILQSQVRKASPMTKSLFVACGSDEDEIIELEESFTALVGAQRDM